MVAFAAYAVSVVGGWIEQIGSFVDSAAAVNVGIVSILLIPSAAMVGYAALYALALLVLAAWPFSRRDL